MKGKKFKTEFMEMSPFDVDNGGKMIWPEDKYIITYKVYMNSVGYYTNDDLSERQIINYIEEDMIQEGYRLVEN